MIKTYGPLPTLGTWDPDPMASSMVTRNTTETLKEPPFENDPSKQRSAHFLKNISLPKNHIQQYTRYLGISNKIQAFFVYLTFFCHLFVVRIFFGETPNIPPQKPAILTHLYAFQVLKIHP